MHRPYSTFWSFLLRFACLTVLVAVGFGFGNAQSFTREPTIDPRVTIKETHYQSESYGTCYWLVLDFGQYPAFTRPLVITPTQSVSPVYHDRELTASESTRGAKLGRLFEGLAGKKHQFENPIPPPTWLMQAAYCIDKTVSNLSNGAIMVTKLPEDKKLNILVPHCGLYETRTVYFMHPKGEFATEMTFMQSPPLQPDSVTEDLTMTLVDQQQQRHHGAEGQMVTCTYWFPPNYLAHGEKYREKINRIGMVPEITVNGKYSADVFYNDGYYPSPVKYSTDTIRFFVPNAFFGADGKANVDVRFDNAGYQKVHGNQLALRGQHEVQTLKITSIELKKLLPLQRSSEEQYHIYITVGNSRVTPPIFLDNGKRDGHRIPFKMPQTIAISFQHGDSVGIRMCYGLEDIVEKFRRLDHPDQYSESDVFFLKPQKLRHRRHMRRIFHDRGHLRTTYWQFDFNVLNAD